MSEIPRVKVVNPGDGWLGTEYYINDKKIERVKAIDFRVAVDEVPTFVFETIGAPDIDMSGDVRFSFTPQTVKESVVVLRNELLKNGDLYDGFLASIKSALADLDFNKSAFGGLDISPNDYEEIPIKIMQRLIGEE